MNIKYIIKYILVMLLLPLVSCQSFEDINTNKQGVTPEMAERDGVAVGAFIQALQRQVVPVGTSANKTDVINAYQVAYHLGPDTWSGYFAQNADWYGGRNHTTYELINAWIKASYEESYTKAFSPWLSIKKIYDRTKNEVPFALAQILKISAWHKTTDFFGPIPYSKAGSGSFITPYDSQEDVYKLMLEDLDKSIKVLSDFHQEGGLLFPDYDLIYKGNTARWIKYANSLMLRMSMRLRVASPELSKKYAELAVNSPLGVMTELADGASISAALGLQFENPIERTAGQYAETKMGLVAFSYLAGYEDPRLRKFYRESESDEAIDTFDGKYLPLPPGVGLKKSNFDTCSKPNIERTTPVYWLRTSEVMFLLSEAALYGYNAGGTAEDWYKRGIAMSFAEHNISEDVDAYINSDKKPADVNLQGVTNISRDFSAPSDITVKFTGSVAEKLEKIITQKWIALYPNGFEAWTEWRRTGYPKMTEVVANKSNGIISSEKGIRRLHYYETNRTEDEQQAYDKAVELLGGADNGATNLWWNK